MLAVAPALAPSCKSVFPLAEVQARLRRELEEAEAESVVLHPGWQPVLDSLRMVTAIAAVENLFDFKLPPEKVVKAESTEDGAKHSLYLWMLPLKKEFE